MGISGYLKVGAAVVAFILVAFLYIQVGYYKNSYETAKNRVEEVLVSVEKLKSAIAESQETIKVLEKSNSVMEDRVFEAEGMLSTCAKGYDKLREDLGKAKNVPKQKIYEYYGIDFESGAALLRTYNADVERLRSHNKN